MTFKDLGLSEAVAKAVEERGYAEPTPVQAATFEPVSAGRDVVVQARTGTGKTAAFALPLVSSRVRPDNPAVQALILCPTRELALQVTREVEALSQHTSITTASVYGGASITKQLEELRRGAQVVVGTPGRVLDHLKRKTLDTSQLRCFVLDECDEMLSMGFLPQISDIWGRLPTGHQTLLFSATVPKEVTRIANTRLRDPQYITLSGDHVGALEIQHFVYLTHGDKLGELLQIIEVENPESAIVFCNTRDETKRVAQHLQKKGFEADWLNADLTQAEREQVMRRTRESQLRFLVCTDVAARGIDISHLTHVINYDFPDASESYVHRTGRTGRAGRMGTAISLISPSAIGDLYYLRLKYKIQPQERHLPTRQERETREQADVIASLSLRFAGASAADTYYQMARRLLTSDAAESIIAGLLRAQLGTEDQAIGNAQAERRARAPQRVPEAPPTVAKERPRLPLPRRSDAKHSDAKHSDAKHSDAKHSDAKHSDAKHSDAKHSDAKPAGATVASPEARRRSDEERPRRARREASRLSEGDLEIRYQVSDAPVEVPVAEIAAIAPRSGVTEDDVDGGMNGISSNGDYVNLYVGVGRRDGAHPRDLQQAFDAAGIPASDRGRISIKQRHSFVEVRPAVQDDVIAKLNGASICGREALVEAARPRE